MFDTDQLIADCQAALSDPSPNKAVREVVARAVADPEALMAVLGTPAKGGAHILHRADDLTVLNVLWAPKAVLLPHDHAMWAVIGVYAGREDNILWRRIAGDAAGRIEAAGAKSLAEGETIAFGPEVVHSVINPLSRVTGALHVYGGDFFATPRSEWDPEKLEEGAYDIERVMRAIGG
jgi:predicted metal-dependent enzyme (double-stranded beta helix superfamily)